MLKSFSSLLLNIPFVSKLILSSLVYLGLSILYSNVTWPEIRTKLPLLNRAFYSKHLSVISLYEEFNSKDQENIGDLSSSIFVSILSVQEEAMRPSLTFSSLLEAKEKVELYSKVSGRIEAFYVKEGDHVSNNQKLVQLEHGTFSLELKKQNAIFEASEASYQLAKDKLEMAKKNLQVRYAEYEKRKNHLRKSQLEFERFANIVQKKEELRTVGAISEEELNNLKLELEAKEIAVKNANRDVEMISIGLRDEDILANQESIPQDLHQYWAILQKINTKLEQAELLVAAKNVQLSAVNRDSTQVLIQESLVKSPIQGIVAKINKNVGELINGGSGGPAILTLISEKGIYALFTVNEVDVGKIKIGQMVNVSIDSLPGKEVQAVVKRISPLVDQKTHTAEVRAEFIQKETFLRPGMFVRSEVFIGPSQNVILVPIQSLLQTNGTEAEVFLIKDGRSFKQKIRIGEKKEDRIIVESGLEVGDSIAVTGVHRLYDGALVQIEPR
ncbi:HlyD family secretion protein [Leptospira ryugenii]|uniref:HlyD family secretion protein n=1 Tax=Leptospira ryugenii TaxID=1917863 RepID=A0A2P2E0P1_9LEPT|nr:efflux RND transporter periplasmic adaptor subunit [Leptospira ryugenii]GBF50439.1 HlyD family secretion protein [Leptospira ryugenii]